MLLIWYFITKHYSLSSGITVDLKSDFHVRSYSFHARLDLCVNLTQTTVTREEGALVKELPP